MSERREPVEACDITSESVDLHHHHPLRRMTEIKKGPPVSMMIGIESSSVRMISYILRGIETTEKLGRRQ